MFRLIISTAQNSIAYCGEALPVALGCGDTTGHVDLGPVRVSVVGAVTANWDVPCDQLPQTGCTSK